MKNQYIGFGLFSEFVRALNKDLPVDCMAIEKINPGKRGIAFCYSIIVVSQAQATGIIYLQFKTASYTTIGGQDLGDKHIARTESAHTSTLGLLSDYVVRPALQSFPKNLNYLEGQNDLLRYDKEKDMFFLKELFLDTKKDENS